MPFRPPFATTGERFIKNTSRGIQRIHVLLGGANGTLIAIKLLSYVGKVLGVGQTSRSGGWVKKIDLVLTKAMGLLSLVGGNPKSQ